jgi:hypothetical protein
MGGEVSPAARRRKRRSATTARLRAYPIISNIAVRAQGGRDHVIGDPGLQSVNACEDPAPHGYVEQEAEVAAAARRRSGPASVRTRDRSGDSLMMNQAVFRIGMFCEFQ